MTTPTLPYGATVDGVRDLLPHRTIDATSKPNEADVVGYLAAVGARVAVRLGPSSGWAAGTVEADVITAARGLVELGAGAYTDDASFPERASTVGSSRYGAVLWERYKDGLDELVRVVRPPAAPGTVTTTGAPAIITRPPLFTRAGGY